MTEKIPFPCEIWVSALVGDNDMVVIRPQPGGQLDHNSRVVVGSQAKKDLLLEAWDEFMRIQEEGDFLARLDEAISQMPVRWG